ncbi:FAD-binding protein [Nocardiopsis gilva]|uniref:FAD-binding protein n=1 Tax=Nocardiopsis gilva TaxID=280236 RepID=UPI0018DFFAC4|nr:FAD-binding protein [Nocardiopsis gilva]
MGDGDRDVNGTDDQLTDRALVGDSGDRGVGAPPLCGLPPLDGELAVDPLSRAAAADDFGHHARHYPRAVLHPGSVTDIEVMVRYCRDRRIPVAACGQGHATNGQAQAEGGLVIEMGSLRGIEVREDCAEVQAGARWSDVLGVTLAHGRTPPVLTDYLGLSVGGTLSVGGLGGATHRYGAQVDTVRELEVVTGAGTRVVCSPQRRADLFHAVLGGLGQCAIITRATVALTPAPPMVRRYELPYPTIGDLTADQRRVVGDGRFDYVEGNAEPAPDGAPGWRYTLEAASYHDGRTEPDDALLGDLSFERGAEEIEDMTYLDFADRVAPGVEYLKWTGEWYDPHPWLNLLLPDTAVDGFTASVMERLTAADIGPSGVVLLYPVPRALLGTPLPRTPDTRLVFLFALLKTATPGPGVPDADAMIAANRSLYERARDLGAVRYPVGSVPMSRGDWEAHFGDQWPVFAAAKRAYDPAGILAPGQGILA